MFKDINQFRYDLSKDQRLRTERGIGFEDVITCISNGKLLDILPHYNQLDYPGQKIMVIEKNDYAYLVPYKQEEETIHLITIWPSRKATKCYISPKETIDESA